MEAENQLEFNLKSKLEKLSNELFELNQALAVRIKQFVTFIDKFYYPRNLTPRIKEFYRYDFKEFVDELESQDIKLRTRDTIEIIDLFDYVKSEIQGIQNRINDIQCKIQSLVGIIHHNAHSFIGPSKDVPV